MGILEKYGVKPIETSGSNILQKYGVPETSTPKKIDILEKYGVKKKTTQPDVKKYLTDTATRFKEHPIKSIISPYGYTGVEDFSKLAEEHIPDKAVNIIPSITPFKKEETAFRKQMVGALMPSPLEAATMGISKLKGLPIKGTTLGRIAKEVPIGKGFSKTVGEIGAVEQAVKNLPQRVAQSQAPLKAISSQIEMSPVQKITNALKGAKPLRAEQEAIYSIERSKRSAKIAEAGKVGGEEGFFKQLSAAKGEMDKVQFEGIRNQVSQKDVDSLFDLVEKSEDFMPFEKLATKKGLIKLLGAEGGSVPTQGEINLLSKIFPEDFIQTVLSKKSSMQRLFEGTAEVLNIPRAIMASFDLSAPLRQGVFLVGRPKQFLPAFRDMFKYAFSEKAYQGLLKDIQSRPTYELMQKGRLALTDVGQGLTGREEAFMSRLAERIPVIGKGIRASDRAYTGFLNKLRADVFDDILKGAEKSGVKATPSFLEGLGDFVSTATGRGRLPKSLENASIALNSVLFSPRLMASRVNLLNPVYYAKLPPYVRKEALKSLLTFSSTALSVLGLAKMGGAEVGVDPRSSEFGKIKVKNTRYDILGGFAQYLRLGAQFITGEKVSSTTGVVTKVGEGYKPTTRQDIIRNFFESKMAPVASFVNTLMKGKPMFGGELNIPKEIGLRFVPMLIQDMYDIYQEGGLKDLWMGIPAIGGVGTQTYSADSEQTFHSMKTVTTEARSLIKKGKIQDAKKLVTKNLNLIEQGIKLEPYQKNIDKIEQYKKQIKENVNFPKEEKIQALKKIDDALVKLKSKRDELFKTFK